MKVIIAGSRGVVSLSEVAIAVEKSGFAITEEVSGTARGVDKLGEQYANAHGIPVKQFPADWNRYGKSAGYRRNEVMARYADALIAIWDGQSPGTRHMINIARQMGLKVYVHRTGEQA